VFIYLILRLNYKINYFVLVQCKALLSLTDLSLSWWMILLCSPRRWRKHLPPNWRIYLKYTIPEPRRRKYSQFLVLTSSKFLRKELNNLKCVVEKHCHPDWKDKSLKMSLDDLAQPLHWSLSSQWGHDGRGLTRCDPDHWKNGRSNCPCLQPSDVRSMAEQLRPQALNVSSTYTSL